MKRLSTVSYEEELGSLWIPDQVRDDSSRRRTSDKKVRVLAQLVREPGWYRPYKRFKDQLMDSRKLGIRQLIFCLTKKWLKPHANNRITGRGRERQTRRKDQCCEKEF